MGERSSPSNKCVNKGPRHFVGILSQAHQQALAAASASVYNNRCAELHLARACCSGSRDGRLERRDPRGFRVLKRLLQAVDFD
jgi:hypothetical protein